MNKIDDFIELRQKVEIWTNCVIEKIKRIRDDCKRIDESEDFNQKWKYNMIRIGDDHFLRVSMNNTLTWLKEMNKHIEETNEIYEELSKVKEIKDLRNMAEHKFEYYGNNGNSQKRYFNNVTKLSASETGILDGEYLIGGRLSLSYIENKFNKLNEIIEKNNFTMTIFGLKKMLEVNMEIYNKN